MGKEGRSSLLILQLAQKITNALYTMELLQSGDSCDEIGRNGGLVMTSNKVVQVVLAHEKKIHWGYSTNF